MDVDKQITDAFAVIAVLVTFVFAFFTILAALTESLLGSKPPDVDADKERVKGQALAYAVLFAIIGAVALLVAVVTVPIALTVLGQSGWLPWQPDYRVVRGGLVLTDLCIVGTLVAAIVDFFRLLGLRSRT